MSKYKEIASMIEEKIVNGYYDETNKLLTEDVLIKEYQSSSNTIQGSGVLLRKGDSEGAINLENFTGKPNSWITRKLLLKLSRLNSKNQP